MFERFEELLQDQDFAEKLVCLEEVEEVQELLAENGVDFTIEEINALKVSISNHLQEGELSDDDLGDVAGGLIITGATALGIAKVAVAVVGLGLSIDKWTNRRW